jgi:hypothetical protein
MNEYDSLCYAQVPVLVTLQVPDVSFQGQPFVYSTRTYIPGVMSPDDAETLLTDTVRNGAIAFFMESMGYDEAGAVTAVHCNAVKVERLA